MSITNNKIQNYISDPMDKQHMVKVEVDVIRKTTFEFTVEAVLDSDGDIDVEATKEKAYKEYEKSLNNNTLHNHFYDEDLEYEIGDEV